MTKYQDIAQMLDANAIQNIVDAYEKGRADAEEEAENRFNRVLDDEKRISYQQGSADIIEKIIELAHEDATTGNMVINLADVEKLKNSKEKTDDKSI